MRVAIDTNILFSSLYFPGKMVDRMLRAAVEKYTIVLTKTIADEFKGVVLEDASENAPDADSFIASFPFEYIYTPEEVKPGVFQIRDPKDYKILYSVIVSEAEIFITGDKDFMDVHIEGLEICTPRDFMLKYLS